MRVFNIIRFGWDSMKHNLFESFNLTRKTNLFSYSELYSHPIVADCDATVKFCALDSCKKNAEKMDFSAKKMIDTLFSKNFTGAFKKTQNGELFQTKK